MLFSGQERQERAAENYQAEVILVFSNDHKEKIWGHQQISPIKITGAGDSIQLNLHCNGNSIARPI